MLFISASTLSVPFSVIFKQFDTMREEGCELDLKSM